MGNPSNLSKPNDQQSAQQSDPNRNDEQPVDKQPEEQVESLTLKHQSSNTPQNESDTSPTENPMFADMRKHYLALEEAVYQGYIDVTKGQMDRITTRSQVILTAASAIATVYGVVLGLRFSLSGNTPHSLPISGLIPVFFLGMAVVLTVVYLDYLTPPQGSINEPSSGLAAKDAVDERNTFIQWVQEATKQRLYALHMAIISLGFGVVTLPVSFLDPSYNWVIWLLLIAGILGVLLPLVFRQ